MRYLTQFYYEKTWSKVSEQEAMKLIQAEFPDIPAEDTLKYVEEECKKGKTITIGECRFKADV